MALHRASPVLNAAPPATLPAADCSSTQQFDAASGTCSCQQGWSGPGTCSACQTGAACDALFNTSGATCSSEVAFQQGMPFKAYTCDLAVSWEWCVRPCFALAWRAGRWGLRCQCAGPRLPLPSLA